MDLLDFRKERRKYYVYFMQYNSIKKSLKHELFWFSMYSVRRRHELRVARNSSHCNLTIIVAISRNELWQLKATNSLTVTSQMLCPLTTTNCGGGRSQNWPLNWPQKGRSGNFGSPTTTTVPTASCIQAAETSLHRSHVLFIYMHMWLILITIVFVNTKCRETIILIRCIWISFQNMIISWYKLFIM